MTLNSTRFWSSVSLLSIYLIIGCTMLPEKEAAPATDSKQATVAGDCQAPSSNTNQLALIGNSIDANSVLQTGALALGSSIVDELQTNLVKVGLTEAQAYVITNGAKNEMVTAIGAFSVDTSQAANVDPISVVSEPIVGGAMAALGDPCVGFGLGLTEDNEQRILAANIIMGSTTGSLGGGRTAALPLSAVFKIMESMISAAVKKLPKAGLVGKGTTPKALGAVTSGSVGALPKAGIALAQTGEAAQSLARGAVSALANVGEAHDQIGALAGNIAGAAILGLAQAGLSPQQIIESKAISQIVSGASSGIVSAGASSSEVASSIGSIAGAAVGAFASAGMDSVDLKKSALADVVGGSMEGVATLSAGNSSLIGDAMSEIASQSVAALSTSGFAAADIASATSVIVQSGIAKIADMGTVDAASIVEMAGKMMEGAMEATAELASSGFISEEQTSAVASSAISNAMSAFETLQDSGFITASSNDFSTFTASVNASVASGFENAGASAETISVVQTSVEQAIVVQEAKKPQTPVIDDISNLTINEDASSGVIAVTVSDSDSDLNCSGLTFSSSNLNLIAKSSALFSGKAPHCKLQFSPIANASGSSTITVGISDGELSTQDTFVVTVKPANDAPVISDISDLALSEDESSSVIAVTISDIDSSVSCNSLTFSSSDTGLVANSSAAFSGTAPDCILRFASIANASGTSTLTVSISDGSLVAKDSFVATVIPVNDSPVISDIANRSMSEDANSGAIAVTISDIDSNLSCGSLTFSSSDTNVVANSAAVFSGTAPNCTLQFSPVANASGTSTLTVSISDGSLVAQDSFVATVTAVNDAPVISDIGNHSMSEDANSGAIAVTISDIDSSVSCSSLTFNSSDTNVVANASGVFSGTSPNCSLIFSPTANANGTSTITVGISDGSISAQDTFVATVNAVNDAPTIGNIADQGVAIDQATSAISFAVSDIETAAASLSLSGTSSNTTLVPNNNIVFGGADANRTVTVTPASGQSGSATITVTVSDGSLTSSDTFVLTVTPAACASGYVLVPADSTLVTQAFCVMKYEAKNNGKNFPVSSASGLPWISIPRGTDGTISDKAWKTCKSLGQGFDLISNSQWQAIARNIEGVSSNWSNGSSSGSNAINRGHSDNSPASILAASTDNDPCFGTSNTSCATNSHSDFTQKRTHTLSNNQVIWDVAGNAWEWVKDDSSSSQGTLSYTSQITSQSYDMLKWGPAGDYSAKSSGEYGGLGISSLDFSNGSIYRGGSYGNGAQAGIFSAVLNFGPLDSSTLLGFRCVTTATSPSISMISDQSTSVATATAALPITLADTDDSAGDNLTLSGSSSNTVLIPDSSIVFGGSGTSRTVTLTPAAGQTGLSTITLTVTDASGYSARSMFQLGVCPTNYSFVPSDANLSTQAFCLMKYEAKNVSSVATSQPSGSPWANINRGTDNTTSGSAWKACRDLGPAYDLMSNAQWQAVSRNIEGVSSNWSNGSSSGTNTLNIGNGGGGAGYLEADSDDSNGCYGITYGSPAPDPNCGGAWHFYKRTHTLSNGQVVWDLSSNIWEWVQDNSSSSQGANAYTSALTAPTYNMLKWGPAGNYTDKSSPKYGGLGYGMLNYSTGAILRGGETGGTYVGLFTSYLAHPPTGGQSNIGFRCVMNHYIPLPLAARDWNADSISGSNGASVSSWADSIASKNATTGNQNPTLAINAVNGHSALSFNGSNQSLQVAAGDTPTSSSTAFTIALVFKPAAAGVGNAGTQWYGTTGLVDAEQGGGTNDWGLCWNSANKVAAGIGLPDNTHDSAAIALNTAHIVIYSWNGSTGLQTLNVDGVTTTRSTAATSARNSYRFLIGSMNAMNYFNGQIATLKVYSSALSSTDFNRLGYSLGQTYGITTSFTN